MNEHVVLLPVLIPLVGAMVALIFYRKPRVQGWWALGTMATAVAASFYLLFQINQTGQMVTFVLGGWEDSTVGIVGISFVADWLSAVMTVMTQVVIFFGLVYALGSKDKVITYPIFYPLFLTLCVGLTGTFLTGDLFNLFVFAELLVISGAGLTASSDDAYGTEAAYKYFYMSLLAAAFLLLACGTLYAAYGTLNMAQLAVAVSLNPDHSLVMIGIALLTAAFMLKSAIFPFHFWQPDFHTAAPTAVSAMLSSVVVKLGVYGFLRMTTLLFVEHALLIQRILLWAGLAGLFFGGLAAIGTHNLKRMLAYSTLAQVGYILIGLSWGTGLALTAVIIYTLNHSFIKAAMLMLAGAVASRAPIKSASYSVVSGLGKYLPLHGLLFFIGGLALAGIPPTSGFISKMTLFLSGIERESFGMLALVGLGSFLSILYGMRAFQKVWWLAPAEETKAKQTGDQLLAPALLIGLVLLFGVWGEPMLEIAQETSNWLASRENYVTAVLPHAVLLEN